jgi:hypothetical protein
MVAIEETVAELILLRREVKALRTELLSRLVAQRKTLDVICQDLKEIKESL